MPEFSPQPGLGTIDSLLDGVRAAGLPVDLEVEGAPHELPPGVDLAAYRVVQEALTNALKYAGPAHAWVAVSWGDDELELEIANDGRSDGDGTAAASASTGCASACRCTGARSRAGRATAAATSSARVCRSARRARDPRPHRRRPVARARRVPDDPRVRGGRRGRRRGRRRRRGAGRRRPSSAGRDPHGRPHAERRRAGGDAPPARREGGGPARPHPHDVRPRRVRVRGAARGRERLPAEGHAAGAAGGRDPRRVERRRAALARRSRAG